MAARRWGRRLGCGKWLAWPAWHATRRRAVQAFQQAGRELPLITGDGTSEFTRWWYEENQKNGYETLGLASSPGVGGAALWLSLAIYEGKDVPNEMMMPHARVDLDNLEEYKDMEPNTIVSPVFTQEWVDENILK